ncbi:protein of unknown function [Mucilaginibacter sp. OK268]|uniref:DUF4396 domain-containing protein n=1 Tax=Mucilaginibacter sp. OK268 TaxID=1881048 RepID=UPI000889505F|nr:DUF4396 domain-containing protein [Mucilaginibacter sp. OK268]SDP09565.1 protein of unknown function [Mucilaginibacter sp. OK268]
MTSAQLHSLSVFSMISGIACTSIILIDILRGNQQKMMIMNFVYPISALYAGPMALLFYYTIGQKSVLKKTGARMLPENKPFWQSVAIGALHCGSGCTIGDLLAEAFLIFVPISIFGSKLAGTWTIDFLLAFGLGIIFQYYAIKPMKNLAVRPALMAALKADTFSLIAWQVGMYGWMALCFYGIFGYKIPVTSPLFWFMMQIGMLWGFVTAYPVNWWLIKRGIKEKM